MPNVLRTRFASFNVDKNDEIHICCDCDEREYVGVLCRCFSKHARDGEVDLNYVMELGMFDVRWLKIYNSHYGCEEDWWGLLEFVISPIMDTWKMGTLLADS